MKKIKVDAVIFDKGNTLELNPFDEILKKYKEYLTEPLRLIGYEKPSAQRLFINNWIAADSGPHQPYESHSMQEERIIQEGLKKSGVELEHIPIVAPLILARYREKYAEDRRNDPRREEVRTALSKLKEKQKILAILSGDRDIAIKASGIYMGYSDLIDASFSSEQIGQEIPKPFPYVLDKLNLKPERTVSVGDSLLQDINDAKELGMKAILYIPPKEFRNRNVPWRAYTGNFKHKPDARIKDMRELLSIIV